MGLGTNRGGIHGWCKALIPHVKRETGVTSLTVANWPAEGKIQWVGEGFNLMLPSNSDLPTIVRRIKEARDAVAWGEP